jgi:hypothetical protein
LESFDWYTSAFKRRDYDKLKTLAIGIQSLRQKGLSESDAYNQMQDLGLSSAWATMERVRYLCFNPFDLISFLLKRWFFETFSK